MESLREYIAFLVAVPLGWVGSFEWRLRGKVSHKTFDATVQPMQTQNARIESHLWDIMKERGIEPTMAVPENIKNGVK